MEVSTVEGMITNFSIISSIFANKIKNEAKMYNILKIIRKKSLTNKIVCANLISDNRNMFRSTEY